MIKVLSQQVIIEELSNNLSGWKKQFGIKNIALFGSYSTGKQTESSDIDLLVEFEQNSVTFDNYMDLKFRLEDIFEKSVDLVILDDIKPALKSKIIRSAKYAEGA